MINGTNLGKPYPPINGAAGRTPPVVAVKATSSSFPVQPATAPSSSLAMNTSPASPSPSHDQPQRMALLEQMQRNLIEAQRHFQETLAQTHLAFLHTSEAMIRQIGGGAAPGTNGHALPHVAHEPMVLAPVRPMVMTPPPTVVSIPAARFSIPEPWVANGTATPPVFVAPLAATLNAVTATTHAAALDHREIILGTIAELTGYPVEMIELDMELEAGLGIDSIKKVEIFSALQAKIPAFVGVDTGQVATLSTPRAILTFARKLVGETGNPEKN
jgi:hypothetical protein